MEEWAAWMSTKSVWKRPIDPFKSVFRSAKTGHNSQNLKPDNST
jgi:hypothetical protein